MTETNGGRATDRNAALTYRQRAHMMHAVSVRHKEGVISHVRRMGLQRRYDMRGNGAWLRTIVVLYALAAALGWGAGVAAPAFASEIENISVGLHRSKIVTSATPLSEFILSNRRVASVMKHDDFTVSVIGKGVGMTNISLMHRGRVVKQLTVSVLPNVPAIKRFIGKLFPYEEIDVKQINGTIALSGYVSGAETAANIQKLVESYVSDGSGKPQAKVVNLLQLYSGQQVMLVAKIGEIRKEALEDLGLGGRAFINLAAGMLGQLERNRAFRTLAEPKLTAISGESAEFLAGGEFPVPIAGQNGVNAIEYKPFGIKLDFVPTVYSENRIRVDVNSEVSEVVVEKGLKSLFKKRGMPVFNTRKAKTVVELSSGESFMIAGLINNAQALSGYNTIPGVDQVPLFKSLLSSTAFKNKESELVIAVTPHLVHPVTAGEIAYPTDNWRPVSTVDSLIHNKLMVPMNDPRRNNKRLFAPQPGERR